MKMNKNLELVQRERYTVLLRYCEYIVIVVIVIVILALESILIESRTLV